MWAWNEAVQVRGYMLIYDYCYVAREDTGQGRLSNYKPEMK